MLTMTENAAQAVKSIVERNPQVDDGGVRIRTTGTGEGFELNVVSAPEPADTVIRTDGASVYLDELAAIALEDRVLDAEVSDEGAVQFALAAQR
ncbi:HesB/IscA family protein [Microbacterium sp. ASV49]|uniref:Iron-sulfur cluster biosynthesis family protein n=1 Tax=Microbacterium candidum TaxID=3041922 RepID=A0ABT7N3A5_9MICO|nr:iron-sulfur cluster biosynthesis family protein [Microbacterium sp. ASV49]MDL9981186.1 iron-sulfur cluster biosynthesis family protein [Microbacterium sp. ASV49]